MNIDAPLLLHTESVQADWIDYNGHMNLAYYVLIFDHATDAFLDYIGITEKFRKANQASTFAAELHITYEKEVRQGDEVSIKTQLLGFDEKRIHYFHYMYHKNDGFLVATNELINLYMDMAERRVSVMPTKFQDKLRAIQSAHSSLSTPKQAGHVIGLQGRSRQEP
jgi:acyl-CoA thioester hydrolase